MLSPTTIPFNRQAYMKGYLAGDHELLVYKLASEDLELQLATGDTFAIELEQLPGYHWDRPVIDGHEVVEPVITNDTGVVVQTGRKGLCRFVFHTTTETGSCTILFRNCEAGNTGRPPQLLEARIQVHHVSISPELRAILRCCVGGTDIQSSNSPELVRVPTMEQLAGHPYFYKSRLDEAEDMVMVEYEKLQSNVL